MENGTVASKLQGQGTPQTKPISSFVDNKLRKNYDSDKLMEMVHIALLCTMMLEGEDEVVGKWEAMKNIEEPKAESLPVYSLLLIMMLIVAVQLSWKPLSLRAKMIEQMFAVFTCNDQFQSPKCDDKGTEVCFGH
ncbi:hypothetical protein BDA96_09G065000 [Sorghum bicolor]|uniref:Uncharacterized protein n=1 Tax=Sorghum bicolor TaxID=4558 RepID=A0A921U3R8_SORBI|nr:hypothetical protein BDA96_09G065000 [Sorghum bicolor]